MTPYDYGKWTHVHTITRAGGYAGRPFFKSTTRKILGFVKTGHHPWTDCVTYIIHGKIAKAETVLDTTRLW